MGTNADSKGIRRNISNQIGGIGDYVHFHYQNYLRYGLSRPGKKTGTSGAQYINSIAQQKELAIIERYKEAEARVDALMKNNDDYLSDFLDIYQGFQGKTSKKVSEEEVKAFNEAMNSLDDKIYQAVQTDAKGTFTNGKYASVSKDNINAMRRLDDEIGSCIRELKKIDTELNYQAKTLHNFKQKAVAMHKSLNNISTQLGNNANATAFQAAYANFDAALQDLIAEYNSHAKKNKISNKKRQKNIVANLSPAELRSVLSAARKLRSSEPSPQKSDSLKKLNKAIEDMQASVSLGALGIVTGAHAESIAEMTLQKLSQRNIVRLRDEKIDKIVRDAFEAKNEGGKGKGQFVKVDIKMGKMFGKNYNLEAIKILEDAGMKFTSKNISLQMSAQKADLTIKLTPPGGKYRTQSVGLSIKNYNLSGSNMWISVVDQTPLTTLLFTAQIGGGAETFTNHFLNIASLRYGGPSNYNANANEGMSVQHKKMADYSKALLMELKLLMFLVFEAALTGLHGSKAEIMLVNDNETGTVSFVNVYRLMLNAINDYYRETKKGDNARNSSLAMHVSKKEGEANNAPVNDYTFGQLILTKGLYGNLMKALPANVFEGDYPEEDRDKLQSDIRMRIAKLIADAHQTKISMTLNPYMLRKTMKDFRHSKTRGGRGGMVAHPSTP